MPKYKIGFTKQSQMIIGGKLITKVHKHNRTCQTLNIKNVLAKLRYYGYEVQNCKLEKVR